MTTVTQNQPVRHDPELEAVLIALAPLGERGLAYVDVRRRTFYAEGMLDAEGWSSGERVLIKVAGSLWNTGTVDLGYIATGVDGRFFDAIVNALAARRGRNFATDYVRALSGVSA
jgi:hypothetical protein